MLTDPAGQAMTATHAAKAGRRYRYYVSSELIIGTRDEHADALRVPAAALERVVIDRITRLLADGPGLLLALRSTAVLPVDGTLQRKLLAAASSLAGRWSLLGHGAQREILLALSLRVIVRRHELTIRIEAPRLVEMLVGEGQSGAQQGSARHEQDSSIITLIEPVSLRRSGREMALLVGSTVAADRSDPTLVRLVAKAWALREALVASDAPTFTAFAKANGLSQSYATRLIRMAWLAPDIIEAILDGRQPAGLIATSLMRDTRLPTDWQEQRRVLGFA